jgi:hypothetical protein
MPIIDSKDVRVLRVSCLKIISDLARPNMTEFEFNYLKEEIENEFKKCLRKESFSGT